MRIRTSSLVIIAVLAACGGSTRNTPLVSDDPLTAPPTVPLVLRFAYSFSKEISCSRSFESDSQSAQYSLTLEPSGRAMLAVQSDTSHAFGSSSSRYETGAESGTTRKQSGATQMWQGSYSWRKSGFGVELTPKDAECKTLVAHKGWYTVDCPSRHPLTLSCTRKKVQVFPSANGVPRGSAPEEAVEIEVFACTPALFLPMADQYEIDLPIELPLTPTPGLELKYWNRGMGNYDRPILRFAAHH